MHAHCTQPPENSGKGRGNQGEGSTRMCFLRLTNMPNAMIMDLRKRFFRMTDAFFFFIGCSIDGTSRQPTLRNNRRNVWLRMRFSSLNYMHSNGWLRFRAKGVNGFHSAIDVAEKKLWHNGGFRYSAGVDMALVVARKAERMEAIPGTRTGSEILNPFVEGS